MINNNLIQCQQLETKSIKHILPILFIASLSITIYATTLKNGFVYDDEATIVKNTLIKSLDNLPKLVQRAYFAGSGELTYRPVTTFSYFLDYAVFGLNPWGFHLTNILIHTVNGVLLYIFSILLFTPTSYFLPLSISVLFATHPVMSEAVNAISFREDLLAFFFYIASLILYLFIKKNVTIHHSLSAYLLYGVSCLFYFMALLSKEMALSFPLIICCYEWVYAEKERDFRSILFNGYNIGYIVITLFYIYIGFYLFHNPGEFQVWGVTERLITLPWLIMNYLKLSLFPISLSPIHEFLPVKSIFSPIFLIPLITIIFLVVMAIKLRGGAVALSFGTLFFLITLIPVYNIIPLSHPFAERYLYLPMIVVAIVIGSTIQCVFENRRLALILLTVMLSMYSMGVLKRNAVWKDEHALWSDTARKMPDSSQPHHYLGYAYYRQGQLDEAIKEYETAIRLKPDNADARNNLGNLYDIKGRAEDAIREYMEALKYKPDNELTHYNLGSIFYRQGRFEEAEREYKTALELDPDYVDALNNLGILYEKQGQIEKAINQYMTALRINPDNTLIHYNLGLAFYNQGQWDEAINHYLTALRLSPSDVDIHYSLGNAYMAKGLKDKAREEFQITLMLKPDHSPAKRALELLNSSLHKWR